MGDAAYEVYIREHLIKKGMTKPNKLHRIATHFVSAKAQAFLIAKMEKESILTKTEQEYFKRGRNAKSHTTAKNTSVLTYRISTGFEAVFGYLFLSEQKQRLKELADWCIGTIEKEKNNFG
ncbi:Mini-ribonuclease 3 [Liquorilactobacillus oeni]|nr:ribonuclease III domain-containing protein [Liquorilactobacillus oeni]